MTPKSRGVSLSLVVSVLVFLLLAGLGASYFVPPSTTTEVVREWYLPIAPLKPGLMERYTPSEYGRLTLAEFKEGKFVAVWVAYLGKEADVPKTLLLPRLVYLGEAADGSLKVADFSGSDSQLLPFPELLRVGVEAVEPDFEHQLLRLKVKDAPAKRMVIIQAILMIALLWSLLVGKFIEVKWPARRLIWPIVAG